MSACWSLASFVAVLLVLGCARGLNDRAALPPPLSPFTVSPDAPFRARRPTLTAPDQLVHPPQIQRATLGNGMEIIWVERPDVPLVSLSLVVKTAGRERSSSKPALADLTAVGLQFGTRFEDGSVPSRLQVDRTVPNPSVSNVHAGFSLTVLAGAFPAALELLARTVRAPAFTRLGIEAARLSLLENYADTTMGAKARMQRLAARARYGGGPPAYLMTDLAKSAERLDPKELSAFHAVAYRPESTVLIVVGATKREPVLFHANQTFASWENPDAPPPRPNTDVTLAARGAPVIHALEHGGDSSVLLVQAPGVPPTSPDHHACSVLGTLAAGLHESRINQSLRLEQGISYGSSFQMAHARSTGELLFWADVANDEAGAGLRAILDELASLRATPVGQSELWTAQIKVLSGYASSLATVEGTAALLAAQVAHDLPRNYLSRLETNVRAVTAGDVHRVAKRYLVPENLDLVVYSNLLESYLGLAEVAPIEHWQ